MYERIISDMAHIYCWCWYVLLLSYYHILVHCELFRNCASLLFRHCRRRRRRQQRRQRLSQIRALSIYFSCIAASPFELIVRLFVCWLLSLTISISHTFIIVFFTFTHHNNVYNEYTSISIFAHMPNIHFSYIWYLSCRKIHLILCGRFKSNTSIE